MALSEAGTIDATVSSDGARRREGTQPIIAPVASIEDADAIISSGGRVAESPVAVKKTASMVMMLYRCRPGKDDKTSAHSETGIIIAVYTIRVTCRFTPRVVCF